MPMHCYFLGKNIRRRANTINLRGRLMRGSSAPRAFPRADLVPSFSDSGSIDLLTEQVCGRAAIHYVT